MSTSLLPLSPLTLSGAQARHSLAEAMVGHSALKGHHDDPFWREYFDKRVENLRVAEALCHAFDYFGIGEGFVRVRP